MPQLPEDLEYTMDTWGQSWGHGLNSVLSSFSTICASVRGQSQRLKRTQERNKLGLGHARQVHLFFKRRQM